MRSHQRCLLFAGRRHFELHSRLLAERDGFWLHHPGPERQRSVEVDLAEALRQRVSGGITVINSVDILDQTAARVELLREKQRGEVRAAAAEERHSSLTIAGYEAGKHRDAAQAEDVGDGRSVGAYRLGIVRICL